MGLEWDEPLLLGDLNKHGIRLSSRGKLGYQMLPDTSEDAEPGAMCRRDRVLVAPGISGSWLAFEISDGWGSGAASAASMKVNRYHVGSWGYLVIGSFPTAEAAVEVAEPMVLARDVLPLLGVHVEKWNGGM